jgi:hypothetical protein
MDPANRGPACLPFARQWKHVDIDGALICEFELSDWNVSCSQKNQKHRTFTLDPKGDGQNTSTSG